MTNSLGYIMAIDSEGGGAPGAWYEGTAGPSYIPYSDDYFAGADPGYVDAPITDSGTSPLLQTLSDFGLLPLPAADTGTSPILQTITDFGLSPVSVPISETSEIGPTVLPTAYNPEIQTMAPIADPPVSEGNNNWLWLLLLAAGLYMASKKRKSKS